MNCKMFRSFVNVNSGQAIRPDTSLIGGLTADNFKNMVGHVCPLCRSSCSSRPFLNLFFPNRFFLNLFFLNLFFLNLSFLLGSVSIHDRHEYNNDCIPPKLLVGMPEHLDQH